MSWFDHACMNGTDGNLMRGSPFERNYLAGIHISAKRIEFCADFICDIIAIYLAFNHIDDEFYKKTGSKSSV